MAFENSENTASGILELAEKLHREYVAEGEKKRDKIIEEARAEAELIVSEAKAEGEAIREEADELRSSIESLRSFESSYRSTLARDLEDFLARVTEGLPARGEQTLEESDADFNS